MLLKKFLNFFIASDVLATVVFATDVLAAVVLATNVLATDFELWMIAMYEEQIYQKEGRKEGRTC